MTFAVGDYQATELLATGASAQVWRGRRITTGESVALKVFPPGELAAVRREAALAAAVDHPHVVAVLDVVADEHRVALITEYAAGGDLADLLARRGRLTPGQTLTVLIPLAAALATAHERQVVHGDISAANIVFDEAGRPLLADLGAARAAMESGRPVQATPCDAAPELARAGPPTPATDLFSLGSVALACLVGRPAWPADDLRDVLIQAAAGQWPDLPDDAAPAALVAAVRSLLEHDPDRRPGAASLALDLRSAGRPEPVDLAPDRRVGGSHAAAGPGRQQTGIRVDTAGNTSPYGRHGRHDGEPVAQDAGAPPLVIGDASAPGEWQPPVDTRHPGPASRARAMTRIRADAAAGDGIPADPAGSWFQRLRNSVPPMRRRARRRAVRITALVVAAVVVAVGAGLLGLRWADSGRADPVAIEQLSPAPASSVGMSGARAPSSANPPSSAGVSTSGLQPSTTPSTAQRPVAGGSRSTAHRPPTVAASTTPAAGTSASPAAPTEPAGRADWTVTVQALDQARSQALVRRDPALLDAVYTPDSAARSADAQTIRTLLAQGLRVSGATHRVQSVQPVTGAAATVLVRDSMPSYDVLGTSGSVVGRTPARASTPRVLVLVATAAGYRISEVRPAGSTAPGG